MKISEGEVDKLVSRISDKKCRFSAPLVWIIGVIPPKILQSHSFLTTRHSDKFRRNRSFQFPRR